MSFKKCRVAGPAATNLLVVSAPSHYFHTRQSFVGTLSKFAVRHSLNLQARARMTQALGRLEVSALFITSRTVNLAFMRWCHHAQTTTQRLHQFCDISSRFDTCNRQRRLRCALRQWRTLVSAHRVDREGRRANSHQRAVSQLGFQQRLLRTRVGQERCRQLFLTWKGWLLMRKNAKLSTQLQKLRVKHQQEQQAGDTQRLHTATGLIVSSVRRFAFNKLSRAFGHWHLLATFMRQQQTQATMQVQRRTVCLRSVVLRKCTMTKAWAWRFWIQFCNHELVSRTRAQMDAELAGRDRRLKSFHNEYKNTLEKVLLTRCCSAYGRVTRFWFRTAWHRWVSVVEATQKRE